MGDSLMVDFETLGVSGDSVILSMGLVVFDEDTGKILNDYYYEFETTHQLVAGRTVDNKTVAWWNHTNQKEFSRLLVEGGANTGYIKQIIYDIRDNYEIRTVWSRGHMDFEVLNSFLSDPDKFPYHVSKDVRTLDIFGLRMKHNNHNALSDCKNQVEYVLEVLNRWKNSVLIVEPEGTPLDLSVPTAINESSS